jgi:long-chain acyl-CoA synthetase
MDNIIPTEIARTLDGLFSERVRRSPQMVAYRNYDQVAGRWHDHTWAQIDREVARWQVALTKDGLVSGDRVAVMLRNCPEWVTFDQAALGLGLVVVPLYTEDRAENAAYILRDSGARLLLLEDQTQWQIFYKLRAQMDDLFRIVMINSVENGVDKIQDNNVIALRDWLPEKAGEVQHANHNQNDLATIMYTSGTSGRPKGVMLSHHNLLTNANSCLQVVPVWQDDLFLSFLPLSHAFERTVGYYLPLMCGATVAYARSIQQLQEDLASIRPSVLISVPRIYERVYEAIHAKLAKKPTLSRLIFNYAVEVGYSRFEFQQQRGPWKISHLFWPLLDKLVAKEVMSKLGGRLRLAMGGGAALSTEVSRMFIGLGLPILQGYGMTECGPVACTNTIENNVPSSVGNAIPGVEVKLGENNALLIHGPNVMLGYWNNPEATASVLTQDGWLNSGDMARIDEGRITITGRLKDIIVMSTGEKIPPTDMEAAILRDPLFEQVMLLGEGRSYLSLLVVMSPSCWESISTQHNLDPDIHRLAQNNKIEGIILERVAHQIREFPGYAKIHRAALVPEPWTVENGMLTPTLKLKRAEVLDRYKAEVSKLYEGH